MAVMWVWVVHSGTFSGRGEVHAAEVAAFMDIVSSEGAAGDPGMASALGEGLPLLVHLLPGLFADHDMEVQALAARLGEFVVDGIDPGEALLAPAPCALEPVLKLQGLVSSRSVTF